MSYKVFPELDPAKLSELKPIDNQALLLDDTPLTIDDITKRAKETFVHYDSVSFATILDLIHKELNAMNYAGSLAKKQTPKISFEYLSSNPATEFERKVKQFIINLPGIVMD